MDCTTWLTEERIVAPAAGAPSERRMPVVEPAFYGGSRIQKQPGLVPTASGPGPVAGSASLTFHSNGHIAISRTAWDGTPLVSRGDGYG